MIRILSWLIVLGMVIAIFSGFAFLLIWALNTLFGLGIGYRPETFVAVLLLALVLRARVGQAMFVAVKGLVKA